MNTKWTRSSALTPEQCGVITTVVAQTIQDALRLFDGTVDVSTLSEEQRNEAVRLISNGVASELAKALEEWKAGQYRSA